MAKNCELGFWERSVNSTMSVLPAGARAKAEAELKLTLPAATTSTDNDNDTDTRATNNTGKECDEC